ncbi:NDP-hexose 2,3-dehydratase family protein [Streptosporangium sp. NPDC000239]|uniref:NDP-hexose 2,3-dehydratase family protein n=1 Tax=Streptosporangium sp. NPDC000239 TaxID=3154248 RepID=UPI0033267E3F
MTAGLFDLPRLRAREDAGLAERLARSLAETTAGWQLSTAQVTDWLAERALAHRFVVERIPFARLDQWDFVEDGARLAHHSGKFFTVEGLRVTADQGPVLSWDQPIIRQPEVGILGLLLKEFDGVPHLLMQAKMEPGNPNLLQLSPTVQATRSNYTKVHRGSEVRYLEYFVDPTRGRVLADVLQSEQGSWFHQKINRNMIVEVDEDVPIGDDFRWLTLGQIGELLRRDNVVNMDARTVLACAPIGSDEAGALHSDTELLSWFTAERARREMRVELTPLTEVNDWRRGPWSIDHDAGRYFSIVAVSVAAGNREVTRWTQPLLEPHGLAVTAFLTRRIGGVPHVLVHAKAEAGLRDTIELAPTVQYTPENYAHLSGADRPPFLDLVLTARPESVRYRAIHSEEGGRFLNAEGRYLVVDVDEADAPLDPPPGFRWVTPGQLRFLARHPHYVNVQARSLLACLNTGAVGW